MKRDREFGSIIGDNVQIQSQRLRNVFSDDSFICSLLGTVC